MPYGLTRNFYFGKIRRNNSKQNETERNKTREKEKDEEKNLGSH